MKNTLWNKLNNRNQKRKSNYEISKKTNIPEEKVKEIMNGEREVPTERVDDFVSAISENDKVEREINVATARKWLEETDLKKARMNYNYLSQGELASELGVHTSVICRLENKKTDHVSDGLLIKYYDFLNNDLNKKVKRKKKDKIERRKLTSNEYKFLKEIDQDKVKEWYETFDLKDYLKSKELSYRDFAKELGYSGNSTSLISGLANKTLSFDVTGNLILVRAYAYVNNLKNPQEMTVEPQKAENDEVVKEEENVAPEPEKVHIWGISDEECSKREETNPVADYFKVMDDPYEYDFPTNNVTSTATYNTADGSYHINTDIVEPEKITIYQYIWEGLNKNLEDRDKKIKELENQISRYEKLIDMIK